MVGLPIEAQNFFRLCHLFDQLSHLVANVIAELETHEDMFSPWRVNVTAISGVLGSLVVMMLARSVRGQGATPH